MSEEEPFVAPDHTHDLDLLLFIGGPKDYSKTNGAVMRLIQECLEKMKQPSTKLE